MYPPGDGMKQQTEYALRRSEKALIAPGNAGARNTQPRKKSPSEGLKMGIKERPSALAALEPHQLVFFMFSLYATGLT